MSAPGQSRQAGFVSLVGAGPGDLELLTLRAVRRLQGADAVVYDRLANAEMLDLCPPWAERLAVGKTPGGHGHAQQEINALLVRLAQEGKRVVRLKGGDPFVFGRGGEEALALAAAGVPFEIVPGISSALAVPAVAGIPVTHRGVAASVTIATGHAREGSAQIDHDWNALAHQRGTLVFLMAVESLDHVVGQLLQHGRSPDEPVALVESGTTSNQRTVRASLATIVEEARVHNVHPPSVLVVGPVVDLAADIGERFTPTCPAPWPSTVEVRATTSPNLASLHA